MGGAQALPLKTSRTMEITLQTICQYATNKVRAAKSAEMREKYGNNTIVLFESETHYMAYDASAEDLSRATGIYLNNIDGMITGWFPKKADTTYFPKCIREGYKIAILDANM